MGGPIVFYCEFSSPYAYIAMHLIDTVAAKHGRAVAWRPISLGHLWKAIGRPLETPKAKMDYSRHDWLRFAKLEGIPMTDPKPFPVNASVARNLFYRLARDDQDLAVRFARAAFNRYWGEGQDIGGVAQLQSVATALNVPATELDAATVDELAKQDGAAATAEAVQAGAFGTPTFLVDGEMFWGADRIAQMDRWLAAR